MKKILFLHGFYASGQCIPAVALREAFEGRVEVITPDLPMHPKETLRFIRGLIEAEKPDLLIGNSCGAFYAQMVAPVTCIPALLGNPHFRMTEFLKQRIGEHQYKSPRKDGNQNFVIDEALIEEFDEMEAIQFDNCHPDFQDRIWGLFGEQDTLAHFEPLFLQHYNRSFHFPGGHTPTAEEVCGWYVPLAEKLLNCEKAHADSLGNASTARRDHLLLPDGREIPEYYVLEYPDWVNVIAITKDGHFVMERQYRHALGCTCYELPCGVMEEGETPLEAAQRELEEETGYAGGEWKKLIVLSANPGTMTNLTHCFLATGVEKTSEQHLDATEELEVHLLTREEVCSVLRNNEMMQSLMVAPLLKYLSLELK